jgi:hypothetical protein
MTPIGIIVSCATTLSAAAVLIALTIRCDECGSLRTTYDEHSHFDDHTQCRFTHAKRTCKACGHVRWYPETKNAAADENPYPGRILWW